MENKNELMYWALDYDWIDTDTIAAPPHEVRDTEKFDKLCASLKSNGWTDRPLLAYNTHHGLCLATGSHRYAAAKKIGLYSIPIIIISQNKFEAFSEDVENEQYLDRYGLLNIDDNFDDLLSKIGDNVATELFLTEQAENNKELN